MGQPLEQATLLGAEYWVVWSTPCEVTTLDMVMDVAPAHVEWLLELERAGVIVMSGPITSGPDVKPGTGVTIYRADSAEAVSRIAERDPFYVHGLRTFSVYKWVLNEGSINIRLSLGTGTFEWL